MAFAVLLVLATVALVMREETRSIQVMSLKIEAFEWVVTLPFVSILGAVATIIVSAFIIRDKITQKHVLDTNDIDHT